MAGIEPELFYNFQNCFLILSNNGAVALAAYFFKRNFFQRPQNERHYMSWRHVATCLQDMSRNYPSFVASKEGHFFVLSQHFFGLKECRCAGTSHSGHHVDSCSQRASNRVHTSYEIHFAHVRIITSMCNDCNRGLQVVRTGPESNLRI